MTSIPASRLPELRAASAMLMSLAGVASDRMSVRQAAFFLVAAKADIAGSPLTRTQILTSAGVELGQSIRNSYRQLLEPSRVYPGALGWLRTEENPNDLREQLLRLTDKGAAVIESALAARSATLLQ